MAPQNAKTTNGVAKKESSPPLGTAHHSEWSFPPAGPPTSAPMHAQATSLGSSFEHYHGGASIAASDTGVSGGANMPVPSHSFVPYGNHHYVNSVSTSAASPYDSSYSHPSNPSHFSSSSQAGTSRFPPPSQPDTYSSQLSYLPVTSPSPEPPSLNEPVRPNAQPAQKVAGVRKSGKGKGKEKAADEHPPAQGTKRKVPPSNPCQPEEKRGRKSGAANYNPYDINLLLQLARKVLPLGGTGWEQIEKEFNEDAVAAGRPRRTARSLELKLKQLCKTTKPTGSAVVPDHIAEAFEIDDLIKEKAGTRDLSDSEILDIPDDAPDGDSIHDDHPSSKGSTAPGPNPSPPTSRHQSRNTSRNILNNISLALDPSGRQARTQELSLQITHNQQLFQLNNQLRDAHRRNDTLAAQLVESERRYQAAERRADRAEQRSQMQSLLSSRSHGCSSCVQEHISHSHHHSSISMPNNQSPPSRPRSPTVYRQEIITSDGGLITHWLDGSEDDYRNFDRPDSPGTIRITYPDFVSGSSTTAHRSTARKLDRSATEEIEDQLLDDDDDEKCSQNL